MLLLLYNALSLLVHRTLLCDVVYEFAQRNWSWQDQEQPKNTTTELFVSPPHDQHIYLISVIVNLHLMVVFSYVVKDAGVDLLQRVFHISGWVSHIRSPTPIFSPISREYSENIVFHIYHRTFLVAKQLLEVSIVWKITFFKNKLKTSKRGFELTCPPSQPCSTGNGKRGKTWKTFSRNLSTLIEPDVRLGNVDLRISLYS